MSSHRQTAHAHEELYTCSMCDMRFASLARRAQHEKAQHGDEDEEYQPEAPPDTTPTQTVKTRKRKRAGVDVKEEGFSKKKVLNIKFI